MAETRARREVFPILIILLCMTAAACDPLPVHVFTVGPVMLRDLNPNSPTYDEERSLRSPPGKAVLVYFVSYS